MTTRQQTTAAAPKVNPAPNGVLQRTCACGQHAEGGECAACKQRREGTLQRSALGPTPAGAVAPPIVHDVLRSSGQPLDPATRGNMEARFGHDFSQVRVHNDERAAESARAVRANAYAVGQHIAFGTGRYQPHSSAGERLLAHELAHVALSGPAAQMDPPAALPVATEDSTGEQAARALERGQSRGTHTNDSPTVLREAMTEADILKRIAELNVVINDRGFSADERQAAVAELGQLSALLRKGGTPTGPSTVTATAPQRAKPVAAPPPTAADLTLAPNASANEIIGVMRVLDAIRPSENVGGLFTTSYKGRIISLTARQVEQVRASARKALKEALSRSLRRLESALGRYRSQEQVNADFPIASRAAKAYAWISSFGNYSNPAASVYGQADVATANVNRAQAALGQGGFAEAIRYAIEADAASERTSLIVHAYIDQLITGGERLATGLTYTRDAAFLTVGVLAVVVSGGAALGLAPEVIGTGAAGLTVAQTATVVSVSAPLVANLGVAGMKVADGDPVDWGRLAVDTAVQIILARFGGKLSAGIAGKIAGNPATQTLARQALAALVSGTATHLLTQGFTTTVSSVYDSLRGKNVTWDDYLQALTTALTDPTGWFMVVLSSGVHVGAQVKVANATRAQETASPPPTAKATPPEPAKVAATEPTKAAPAAKTATPSPKPAATEQAVTPTPEPTGTNTPSPGKVAVAEPAKTIQEPAGSAATPPSAAEPDLEFSLHIGQKRAAQIQSGEKNFVLDRALTFDIDEVLPVGARDVKPQRAVSRALDPYYRQLLDPNTNQRTKGLGIDPRDLRANRGEYPPVSVVDNPDALLTRRFSEVREMSRIFDRAVASVGQKGTLRPTELKAQINREIRRIIAEDTDPDASAVRAALNSLGFQWQPGRGFTMTK